MFNSFLKSYVDINQEENVRIADSLERNWKRLHIISATKLMTEFDFIQQNIGICSCSNSFFMHKNQILHLMVAIRANFLKRIKESAWALFFGWSSTTLLLIALYYLQFVLQSNHSRHVSTDKLLLSSSHNQCVWSKY